MIAESNPERLPGGTTNADTNQQPSSAAPVDRVVGPFILLCSTKHPFPDEDKPVLVEPKNGDPFFAKFSLSMGHMPWPRWVMGDGSIRQTNPLDRWCNYSRLNTPISGLPPEQIIAGQPSINHEGADK